MSSLNVRGGNSDVMPFRKEATWVKARERGPCVGRQMQHARTRISEELRRSGDLRSSQLRRSGNRDKRTIPGESAGGKHIDIFLKCMCSPPFQ